MCTLHCEVFALACAYNHKRTTTVSDLEQRSRAANYLLNVQFPQQCVGRPLSDGFKSSPSKKSTWVQTCTLLQPTLNLNYNLLERLLTDASLPAPSWIVECFYEFYRAAKVWQLSLQLHKRWKYLRHFWEKAKTQVEADELLVTSFCVPWPGSVKFFIAAQYQCGKAIVGHCRMHLASKVDVSAPHKDPSCVFHCFVFLFDCRATTSSSNSTIFLPSF